MTFASSTVVINRELKMFSWLVYSSFQLSYFVIRIHNSLATKIYLAFSDFSNFHAPFFSHSYSLFTLKCYNFIHIRLFELNFLFDFFPFLFPFTVYSDCCNFYFEFDNFRFFPFFFLLLMMYKIVNFQFVLVFFT